MNRNEMLRRHQAQHSRSRRASAGIPGWLWGLAVGAIAALVAIGVVMRPTLSPTTTTEPTLNEAQPMQSGLVQTEPQQQQPTEIAIVPSQPEEQSAQQNEEIERLRQEVDDLRRQGRPEQAPEPPSVQESPLPENDRGDSRQNVLEQMAQSDAEWRPVYAEFQKRYSEKKAEFDTALSTLKQIQAQCNYTHMGEPTEAEKRRGARQEGLPASLVTGGTVGYGSSCDTVDGDLKKAERDRFEVLRTIQDECYNDATARGVSTAKAKLR
jgi:hypothetical protein